MSSAASSRQVDSDAERSATVGPSELRLLNVLGAGLITGASDDDPSGIATYSQAGALYGFGYLDDGRRLSFDGDGAGNQRAHRAHYGARSRRQHHRRYPPKIVYRLVGLLFCANVINIAADLGAMGDVVTMLAGGPHLVFVVMFGVGSPPNAGLHGYTPLRRCTEVADDRVVLLIATLFVVERAVG